MSYPVLSWWLTSPFLPIPPPPGFPGALPQPRPHHAVPAAERQGAPVDSGERGAGDFSPSTGSGLLPAAPGLLPGRHGDAAPLPAARGGVYWPKEPQVRHEAAVGDLGVKASPEASPFFPPPLSSLCAGSCWITGVAGHVVHSYPIVSPDCDKETHSRRGESESSCFYDHHRCSDIKLWSAQWLSIKRRPWLFVFCVVKSSSDNTL